MIVCAEEITRDEGINQMRIQSRWLAIMLATCSFSGVGFTKEIIPTPAADRYRTDVYEIKRPNGYTLYEFETSKLTNNHTHGAKKEAIFSYNKGNFFGMINFDLIKDDPELTFE